MPCMALEAVKQETGVKQDKKDWAEYSQLIAAAMSKRGQRIFRVGKLSFKRIA